MIHSANIIDLHFMPYLSLNLPTNGIVITAEILNIVVNNVANVYEYPYICLIIDFVRCLCLLFLHHRISSTVEQKCNSTKGDPTL